MHKYWCIEYFSRYILVLLFLFESWFSGFVTFILSCSYKLVCVEVLFMHNLCSQYTFLHVYTAIHLPSFIYFWAINSEFCSFCRVLIYKLDSLLVVSFVVLYNMTNTYFTLATYTQSTFKSIFVRYFLHIYWCIKYFSLYILVRRLLLFEPFPNFVTFIMLCLYKLTSFRMLFIHNLYCQYTFLHVDTTIYVPFFIYFWVKIDF